MLSNEPEWSVSWIIFPWICSSRLQNTGNCFQFLFSEMKLKPHAVTTDLSTVANCSRMVCAGRCFNRDHDLGVWCFPAKQRTWHVSPTGSDVLNDGIFAPLATIQLAVHYANDGDTILLAPGTYRGGSDCTTFEGDFHGASKRRCNYNIDCMGKKITIDGRGRATIDCEAFLFGLMPKRGFIMANGETHQPCFKESKLRIVEEQKEKDILSACMGYMLQEASSSRTRHHKCCIRLFMILTHILPEVVSCCGIPNHFSTIFRYSPVRQVIILQR